MVVGELFGQFRILAKLGEGGMGLVYRARDTKLDRDVAIKILSEAFAHDAERLARFQREAKTLASLNHPNIAAIYGIEESGGVRALVMELVEGDDLSQVIARGRSGGPEGPPERTTHGNGALVRRGGSSDPPGIAGIPLDEALPIAKQIADALEAAHEHSVIHRDLKPANIKVRPDGTVKVLDFGLAKAIDVGRDSPAGHAGSHDPAYVPPSQMPTITTPAHLRQGYGEAGMTGAGMILGTAAYMSPEQARGKTVDKRADIWAFGAVLFEMLTGTRPFEGQDIAETLGAVIHKEPVWSRLPAATPASIRTVLERCLQKDPRQRLRDIGDVRLALEGAFETPAPQTTGKAPPSASRERLAWMALGIAVLGMAALAVPALRHLRESTPQLAPESRTEIVTASGTEPTSFALSPDGRLLVFVASRDGVSQLWLRALESTTAQPLTGTEGASYPFWSPDSRSVAFFADATVKRLDLNGGRPQTLTRAAPRGGAWNASGDILFAATSVGPLFRISAAGGQVAPMTTLDRQASHRFPVFLPDGRRFLYYAQGSQETSGIFLASLDSTDVVRLTQASSAAVYLPAGWLLWVRGGALVGQRLDLERRALTGDLVTLSDLATFDATTAAGAVSASATGLVAFRASGAIRRQLTWFSREGTKLGAAGEADDNGLNGPSVSPDGRRVAVARTVDNNTDIWVVDAVRSTRLMFDPNLDRYPIWSPDGKWIAFDSSRRGTRDLYRMAADGADGAELLLETPGSKTLTSWSRDGRFLFFHSLDGPAGRDLWMLPMDGDRTPRLFLKTPFEERQGQLSPDGRWLAYMSNESGRDEIYVRPFAGATSTAPSAPPGGRWQVSTAGGIYPRWQPEGRELYFLEPAGYMMAAPVVAADTSLTPGSPQRLFKTDIWGGGVDIQVGAQYDVSRDGRFLVNSVVGEAATPITLIQNWQGGLSARKK